MSGRGRVKRQQVNTDDGWTVITHGLSKLSVGAKKGKGRSQRHNAAQTSSMPTAIVDGLTAEKMVQDFHNRSEKWKTTACAQHLESVLARREWDVNEAVCIGIGSFSRDWEHRHRAMWQLVLFMSVVSYLRESGPEVKLYAQEPAFADLDHKFLSLLSIHVCAEDIATYITPRSFVFSPFVDWYILLPIFLKGKDPVLYVGNEILDDYEAFAQSEEKREKLGECNELGREWLEKRDVVRLVEFEMHPHALNGMVVYWVEEDDGGDTGLEASSKEKLDESTTGQANDRGRMTGAEGQSEEAAGKNAEPEPKTEK